MTGGPAEEGGITRAGVLKIAHLARLHLSDGEVELFTKQLNDILAHAQEIAAAELASASAGVDARTAGEGTASDAELAEHRGAGAEDDGASGKGAAPATRHGGAAALRLRDGDAGPDPLLAAPEAFAPAFPEGFFAVPRLEALDEERSP